MKTLTKTIYRISFAAIIMASCTFLGCSPKKLEKGTAIESTKATIDALMADKKANGGKRFAVTGYLYYKVGMAVYTNRPQTAYICLEPGEMGDAITPVDMPWAKEGHNSVYAPDDAGRDETKTIFYDNEGKPFTMNDKVMVSFLIDEKSTFPNEVRVDRVQ